MSDDKKILKEVIADKEKGDVQSRDKAMEGNWKGRRKVRLKGFVN